MKILVEGKNGTHITIGDYNGYERQMGQDRLRRGHYGLPLLFEAIGAYLIYLENRPSTMQQPPEVRGSLYSPEFPGA
ncbi:MAG: hypothetical protein DDT19_00614 [Syntrophomonadaceae bacterium]|nr:hypothetical protein [Bacillota bacterium]